MAEIENVAGPGGTDLLRALQERLFSRDLYWLSAAITSSAAFFGRKALVSEISTELRKGTSHVALFGLRKMGKTSLLFRLLDSLKSDSSILPAHVDIQRIDAVRPSAAYLLWSLGEQLADTNSRVRRLTGLKMFGKARLFSELPPGSSVSELFDHDIRAILRMTPCRIVFLLDEIELMSPESPGSLWGDGFVSVWRLLRGLAQESGGRLVFFLTGTNPRCTEASRLSGVDNPIYNFFDRRFLPPLTAGESNDLLTSLGQRMGLIWQPDALNRAFDYVGGHPFLLRAFASKIHRSLLPRATQEIVRLPRVANVREAFMIDLSSTFTQILEVLADQYKDEYVLLESLANGRIGEFRELARQFPQDLAHLVGYGLVPDGPASSGLSMEMLQSWVQRRHSRRRSAEGSPRDGGPSIGEIVEGYKIVAEVGHRGGFARVYKAIRQDEARETVALKVLQEGSYAALQREITVLEELSHNNLVQIREYGTLDSGALYIAMELLEGPSLREYCDRSARVRGAEFLELALGIVDALAYLHPDEETINRLRTKSTLSVEEMQDLLRARTGVIHRDIKPENIIFVKGRGPVLIDFNISVRVAAPVRTMKQTPGYLPPDGPGQEWSPDIDLFQTGLTLLQVGLGIPFDGANLLDLRDAAEEELGSPVAKILQKMTADRRADRYQSARLVRHDLELVPR